MSRYQIYQFRDNNMDEAHLVVVSKRFAPFSDWNTALAFIQDGPGLNPGNKYCIVQLETLNTPCDPYNPPEKLRAGGEGWHSTAEHWTTFTRTRPADEYSPRFKVQIGE